MGRIGATSDAVLAVQTSHFVAAEAAAVMAVWLQLERCQRLPRLQLAGFRLGADNVRYVRHGMRRGATDEDGDDGDGWDGA